MVGVEKTECCGCGGCESICPMHAISFAEDEKGFLYPKVNNEKCINCGLCISVCSFKSFKPSELPCEAYAVRHCDEQEVATSRSGGFFCALADLILSRDGGVVFGCDNSNVRDVIIKSEESSAGIKHFKGSKYVQADSRNTYEECAEFLKNNRWVLYSGMGCQVHGLLQYLQKRKISTQHLLTVDIVCHGVVSPRIWKQYLNMLEEREGEAVLAVNFRDKSRFGWREHIESYKMKSGRIVTNDNWKRFYNDSAFYRDCCYHCKYTTASRYTDFTIADLWGVERVAPEFDDDKGVSLVLIRTEKAKLFFESLEDICSKKIELREVMQPQLCGPAKNNGTATFWKSYSKNQTNAVRRYFFKTQTEARLDRLELIAKKGIKRIGRLLGRE